MKVLLVAGTRPNFMKIAAIMQAIKAYNQQCPRGIEPVLVHTGQHYDEQMSQTFFRDLALPEPDVNLEVGSASHAQQTAAIMQRFEPVLGREAPDVVAVVGDVNSTLACTLVAAKITYPQPLPTSMRSRPLVAHVEAGLRSSDRAMPEEINRIVTDALADLLFVTEPSAEAHLLREGISKAKIHFVGNTMVDTLLQHRHRAQASTVLARLGLQEPGAGPQRGAAGSPLAWSAPLQRAVRPYAVVTLHRPSNVDDPITFRKILDALWTIGATIPLLFPMHPRTRHGIQAYGLAHYVCFLPDQTTPLRPSARIHGIAPLGYLDFLCLMSHASLVLTDSGGIQEETTVLGVPCVTLRSTTERPVTLTDGTNVLAGLDTDAIIRHAGNQLHRPAAPKQPRLWDGRAGARIIEILTDAVHGERPGTSVEHLSVA